MKSDLDALMEEKKLDAIMVFGNAEYNPPMYYLTGGGQVSSAILIKKPAFDGYLIPKERYGAVEGICGLSAGVIAERRKYLEDTMRY